MTRLTLAATLVLLLVGGVGCGSRTSSQAERPRASKLGKTSRPSAIRGASQLTDLRDIAQLRSLFNTRSGEPRLILLVSPT
jgi:hypothetical protein